MFIFFVTKKIILLLNKNKSMSGRSAVGGKSLLLEKLYFSNKFPTSQFSSKRTLYKEAKKRKPGIKYKDIEEFFASFNTPGKFSKATYRYRRPIVKSRKFMNLTGFDLIEMAGWLKRYNNGYVYVCVAQDIFTRMILGLIPLKNKKSSTVSQAIDSVYEKWGASYKAWTDRGSEFIGSETQKVFKKWGVRHYATTDSYAGSQKVSTVESSIRTIRSILKKMMSDGNTLKWVQFLPQIQEIMNDRINTTTGFSPNEAKEPENAAQVYHNTVTRRELRRNIKPFKYQVGSIVRVALAKSGDKFQPNFGDILYTVNSRFRKSGVNLYTLTDLLSNQKITSGTYTENELTGGGGELSMRKLARKPPLDYLDIRFNQNGREEVLIKNPLTKRNHWVLYTTLLNEYEKKS